MNKHERRLARLEAELAFYQFDQGHATNEELAAWIEAARAKDPAGWAVLEILSKEDVDLLADGDPTAVEAYRERVEAAQRPGSP